MCHRRRDLVRIPRPARPPSRPCRAAAARAPLRRLRPTSRSVGQEERCYRCDASGATGHRCGASGATVMHVICIASERAGERARRRRHDVPGSIVIDCTGEHETAVGDKHSLRRTVSRAASALVQSTVACACGRYAAPPSAPAPPRWPSESSGSPSTPVAFSGRAAQSVCATSSLALTVNSSGSPNTSTTGAAPPAPAPTGVSESAPCARSPAASRAAARVRARDNRHSSGCRSRREIRSFAKKS